MAPRKKMDGDWWEDEWLVRGRVVGWCTGAMAEGRMHRWAGGPRLGEPVTGRKYNGQTCVLMRVYRYTTSLW